MHEALLALPERTERRPHQQAAASTAAAGPHSGKNNNAGAFLRFQGGQTLTWQPQLHDLEQGVSGVCYQLVLPAQQLLQINRMVMCEMRRRDILTDTLTSIKPWCRPPALGLLSKFTRELQVHGRPVRT